MVCSLFALYLDCLQVSLYGDFVYTDNNETLKDVPTNTVGARGENKEKREARAETTGKHKGQGEATGEHKGQGEVTGEHKGQGEATGEHKGQGEATGEHKGKAEATAENEEKGETIGEATAEGKGKRKATREASANRQDPPGNVETEKTIENEFADRVYEEGQSYKRRRGKGSQKKKCKRTKH